MLSQRAVKPKTINHLLVWIRVGQGPTALAEGAGGVVWTFLLSSILFPLSPSLWETTRYRLKYCLKGSLSSKTTNQPTNLWPGHYLFDASMTYTKYHSYTPPKPEIFNSFLNTFSGGGRVVRWSWVNFQCRGVLQF